jgi:L-asparaginase / beta-aspartyl-peptidase
MRSPVIAVHGGAGTPPPGWVLDADRARADLAEAALAGWAVLARGGSALDAVQAAVVWLEDCPRFNAGRGAVLNAYGEAELDAAVMDGASRRAGAVAAVRRIRNPVVAARAVLEGSEHVLLAAEGAEAFAEDAGVDMVDPAHHVIDYAARLNHSTLGTVGAVALDATGALAAATSTGGLRGKARGRVGDSPLVGCGTYANDRVAVSATGHGEAILRAVAAHDVAARLRHGAPSVHAAARAVVEEIVGLDGDVGLLALDAEGNVALPFAADVFHRAVKRADGPVLAAVSYEALEPAAPPSGSPAPGAGLGRPRPGRR